MSIKPKFNIVWNVIFIVFIMLLPIIDAPTRRPTKLLFLDNAYVYIDFVSHAICLGFVYLNIFYLAPRLYFQNQKILYFSIVVGVFLLIAAVPDFIEDNIYTYRVRLPENQRIHILIQIRHIFFIFFSLFFFSLYQITERRRVETEEKRAEAEVNFLKAQINPHFLFNTINSIYSLIHINADAASKALIKMSNIMRYMMNSSNLDTVSLAVAADYIDDYIDLQIARFGTNIEVQKTINIEDGANYHITSLVLLPFIENAFKYGVFPSKPSIITIQLYNKKEQLYFFVGNSNYSTIVTDAESNGIGLENTKKRLKLKYGYDYELKIKNTEKDFKVALTIKLK